MKVPKKIETEEQYQLAIDEVGLLMDENPPDDSLRGRYFYLLVLTIMDWEGKHYPLKSKEAKAFRGNEEARQKKLEENRLLAERHDVETVKKYLNEARTHIQFTITKNRGEGALLIASEQIYGILKRTINRKLRDAGLTTITR